MSSSFLKKSLELADSKVRVISQKQVDDSYSQLKFIGKKKKSKVLRGASDVKRKNIDAVEKVRKELKKQNNTYKNKHKVKLLHKPVNEKILNKILEHIHAPGLDSMRKEKKEESTVFTEEDFIKFEKEYFSNQ